ncbi:MAG: hypothetical protein ACRYG2_01365 [Janthinobacterium lividum]
MATWEDGPEYAPHERPQYFADAPVAPLEQAPRVARPADGRPGSRPRFDEPSAPVAPLATLVPEPPDERDPHRPFDTLTTTLTSESPWGAPGNQPFVATAPFAPTVPALAAAPSVGPTSAGVPTPTVQQPPGQPGPGQPPAAQDPYAYPVPGTPEWFAPPRSPYGDQRQPGRVDAKQVVEAATPGLCICLAVGGLIHPLSPVMLVLAVILSTRVRVAQRAVRVAFRIAAGAVAFFALVGLVRSVFDGDPWWHFVSLWSLLICWVMLAVTLLVVGQALGRPKPPPSTNPWG